MAGAQLIFVYFPGGGNFVRDPSQVVVERKCMTRPREIWLTLNEALAKFPRDAFDYVWLIEPPRYDPKLSRGLQPLWKNGSSVLFRVVDRRPAGASEEPRPQGAPLTTSDRTVPPASR
jgi:hypothetical protein